MYTGKLLLALYSLMQTYSPLTPENKSSQPIALVSVNANRCATIDKIVVEYLLKKDVNYKKFETILKSNNISYTESASKNIVKLKANVGAYNIQFSQILGIKGYYIRQGGNQSFQISPNPQLVSPSIMLSNKFASIGCLFEPKIHNAVIAAQWNLETGAYEDTASNMSGSKFLPYRKNNGLLNLDISLSPDRRIFNISYHIKSLQVF